MMYIKYAYSQLHFSNHLYDNIVLDIVSDNGGVTAVVEEGEGRVDAGANVG